MSSLLFSLVWEALGIKESQLMHKIYSNLFRPQEVF